MSYFGFLIRDFEGFTELDPFGVKNTVNEGWMPGRAYPIVVFVHLEVLYP
jgi:hypothetical protein